MTNFRTMLFIATAALAALPNTSFGWGREGHAIIAEIAEARLTPTAREQMLALLQLDGHRHLAEIASWADEIRGERLYTARWHFVDIPLEQDRYDKRLYCPRRACVVQKIVDFAGVLAASRGLSLERLEALEWVVHLVGDLHQPLHTADHGDREGNDVPVQYFGQRRHETLHKIWDVDIIERGLGTANPFDGADILGRDITPALAAEWAPPVPPAQLPAAVVVWAEEAHHLAQRVAYGALPAPTSGDGVIETLDDAYQDRAWPAARLQLERAGVRLAELLNRALQ